MSNSKEVFINWIRKSDIETMKPRNLRLYDCQRLPGFPIFDRGTFCMERFVSYNERVLSPVCWPKQPSHQMNDGFACEIHVGLLLFTQQRHFSEAVRSLPFAICTWLSGPSPTYHGSVENESRTKTISGHQRSFMMTLTKQTYHIQPTDSHAQAVHQVVILATSPSSLPAHRSNLPAPRGLWD